ncbi:type 1 periplasmic-binding domain-containing protein [Parafrankia discariae]|uniref:ABC transporter substrate-binding protein n=1 Tax=Parafrankia discariae TaxID=365528 RepID=UPI0003A9F84E|nr:ABC transporter substrate-binding protein [Parafrankia discariae]
MNDMSQYGASANAVRQYANDCLGGIAGRPVNYIECRIDESSAAAGTDCANRVVEGKAAALVITSTTLGQVIVPIVTGAGIPYVGVNPVSPAESTDKSGLVFELSPGAAGYLAAMAKLAKDGGMKKVGLVVTENAAQGIGSLAKIPFGNAGVELHLVTVPPGTPDMTAQVTSALSGAGAVGLIGDQTQCISFLQALESLDPDGQHWILRGCTETKVLKAAGAESVDKARIFTTSETTSGSAEALLYRQVMAKYAPETSAEGGAVIGYQAAFGFLRAIEGIKGDITSRSVASTLGASRNIALPAGAGTTFGCAERPIKMFTTVCSSQVIVGTMRDATATDPKPVDVASLLAN